MLKLLVFAVVVAIVVGIAALVHMQKGQRRNTRRQRNDGGSGVDFVHSGPFFVASDTREARSDSDGGPSDGGDSGGDSGGDGGSGSGGDGGSGGD